jgi:hypothetical protein
MDLVEAKARGLTESPRHPWERARLALASRLIAESQPLSPGDVAVDVGCGDTFVVESLAKQYPGAEFYAVDQAFTPDLIDHFRRRLATPNVRLCTTLDQVPGNRTASLVLLMDVLEHVEHDAALLRDLTARSWFGAATRLLITVPAYAGLFCSHDRFLGHHRRYSMQSLRAVLSASRLSAERRGRLFASLVPVRVLQVVLERLLPPAPGAATGVATWEGGTLSARALSAVLEWDGRIGLGLSRVGLRVPGLSLFAICRKSA